MDSEPHKYLIINADDFGLLPEINQGIIECFRAGSITSATLMVNTEGTANAVTLARECPELGIGFHFNLTQGRPVADLERIPTLVDKDGCFHSRHEFEKKAVAGKIDQLHIEKEFVEQIKKIEKFDLNFTHIDSHHHIHLFPSVFKVLSNYAVQNRIPLRIPWVAFNFVKPSLNIKALKSIVRKILLVALIFKNSTNRFSGLVTPQKFLSIYDYIPLPAKIQADHYLKFLGSASAGITEVMVHPAYVTNNLNEMFSEAHIREQELRVLSSFCFQDEAAKRGFQVVSYREVCCLPK